MGPINQKLGMLLVMLCASISASAYDFIVDGIAYTITSFSDLTCAVSPSGEVYEGEILVPSEVIFREKTLTVTSISSEAFKNSQVTSVQIPGSVVKIESDAFANCKDLKTIGFKEGLQSINDYAFYGCVGVSQINLPTTLKTIGSFAFVNCASLQEIDIPASVTVLGESSFKDCKSLKKVSLSGVKEIKANAFNGCLGLQNVEWGRQIQTIRDYAFANCGFTKFAIPNTVTYIGASILSNNENLQSFTIGNGIDRITSNPIAQCPNVEELIIADGTNPLSLDFSSKSYSKILTDSSSSSTEYWDYKYYYIRPGAFNSLPIESVYVGRELSNPNEVEDYSHSYSGPDYYNYKYTLPPFYGNKTIKTITLGPKVISISGVGFSGKYSSFYYGWLEGCSNLETLKISGLSFIPKLFAKGTTSLKIIELPNTTHSIGESAFDGCTSLESIIFGPELSSIDSNALENCNALTSIYCKSKTPPSYPTGFSKDIYLNCNLYIPLEAEQKYKNVSPWNNFWNIIESQECISEFKKDGLIYSVISGNNVVISGNEITDDCDLIIPSIVEYNTKGYNIIGINDNAFKGASKLHSIVIPGCISSISNDAFSDCNGLKSVIIEYNENPLIVGNKSKLYLSSSIPYPNATTVDEKRTGFRNGYYDGLFYGLPIERLIINRDIELSKYYERTMNRYTSSYVVYSTVYNDIVYYPPFYGLTNLKYVEIGEKVSAICKNQIEAIVNAIPTTMNYTNFGECNNIELVVANNPSAPIGGGFSQSVYEKALLFLPNGGGVSYNNDNYWKNFTHVSETAFITIESISFDNDSLIIGIYDNKTLYPIINPHEASVKTLKWSSSNPSIVQVSDDGVIEASSREGEAIITAMACDGTGVSASIRIIVQEGAGISDIITDDICDITVENGKLLISGKSASNIVSVFDIHGRLIISTKDNEVRLKTKGIYIVKIGTICKKIII